MAWDRLRALSVSSQGQAGEKRKHARIDQDGYQEVQQRRPRKVAYGSSKVNIQEEGEAAPVEYYIGNTNAKATEEVIKRVLIKCAAGLDGAPGLTVLEVKLLTKEENPRSKCWKVTVPYKFKEVMEKDDLYHAGWTHRKFFGARNGKGKQKQPRLDDPIEQDLEEQRRLQQESSLSKTGLQQTGQTENEVPAEVMEQGSGGGAAAAAAVAQ